ncbi:GNAT family N-acetyltransferase [Actinomyces polynesiensis]|uniref:GNAT family N-acetyltransferase n=1 Tax=Actinomyces polynesiensis TaxID=1325934 RepID=UPI0005BC4A5A|nr:GNAT family N-acetyltransferase [Actinomyces polynesiensis]
MSRSRPASPDRSVRPALAEDAPAIARIQVAGIREAVGAALGHEAPAIDGHSVEDTWRATLDRPQPAGHHTLVALHGHGVAGFAACAPGEVLPPTGGRPDPIPEGTDILSLEVDADFRRSGHGSRLLAAVVDITRPRTVRVWILAGDDVRVRFYQGAGFSPAGVRRTLATGDGAVIEHLWWSLVEE